VTRLALDRVDHMANDDARKVTRLLGELRAGRPEAANEVAELVHADLLRAAEMRMRGRRGITLEPAALVNECWLRLTQQHCTFESRAHFLAIASRIMLHVLLDADRRRRAARRGGDMDRVTLSFDIAASDKEVGVEVGLLEEALEQLERVAPRKAQVACLRGLADCSIAETAAQLGLSPATVERDWAFARAWLSRYVARRGSTPPAPGEPGSGNSPDS
jgi:RNA polymerase sigma factor (TIGR02999 family)